MCTNKELSEIKNLKVEAALYWLDSDRVDTIEQLSDESLKDTGTYSFDNEANAIVDTRTHKWFGYPLKEFVEPLLKRRLELKSKKDSYSQALQQSLKLMCLYHICGIPTSLTLYGETLQVLILKLEMLYVRKL